MTPPDDVTRAVEAILFAATEPMTADAIGAHVGDGDVTAALARLTTDYSERGISLVRRGDRWQFQTAPDLAHLLRRDREEHRTLSRAGIETLAIIAYHEPVSRAEIEAIRGVQLSKGTLDVLMAAGWVRPAGRREVPGRPLTYATTPGFLVHFGLESRRDLPGIDDLRAAGLLDPVDPAAAQLEVENPGEEAYIGFKFQETCHGQLQPDPSARPRGCRDPAARGRALLEPDGRCRQGREELQEGHGGA